MQEDKIQTLWESYFAMPFIFNYSDSDDIDSKRSLHIGSKDREIPGIFLRSNHKDICTIELKCTTCDGGCTGCTSCTTCDGSCQNGCTGNQTHKLIQYCPENNANGYDVNKCNSNTGEDTYAFFNDIPDWIQAACGLTEEQWDAMTPDQQKDAAKEADPNCEIEERNNTNSVLTEKKDLDAVLQGDYNVDNLIPKAENCEGGQTKVEYYDKTTGKKVLDGTIGTDGKVKLTATDGTTYEYTNNNKTGESDKTVSSEKTNPDGSKNTKPSDPADTSTPSTYTPPPSAENPNPSPQPSGC